jgi:thymidylate synthase
MHSEIFHNKIDRYFYDITSRILSEGSRDINPRPKYEDGTPAHTISINHCHMSFDLSKNEFPILTLRPVPFKSSIGEILWIYQDASNDLKLLKEKYGISWWDAWALEDGTIGACYGETVRRHNLMENLIRGIKENPDGRRHIINLWQEDDFKDPHALKPCCYQTVWNVRHEKDGDYLDMCMFQRSADWLVAASAANQVQYATLLCIVAHCLGYKPGKYSWFAANVQIYDRHEGFAAEMIRRPSIDCSPHIVISRISLDSKASAEQAIEEFKSIRVTDITLRDYPLQRIKNINPQIKFPIGI